MLPHRRVSSGEIPRDRRTIVLQERVYLIDGEGPSWRVRLHPLDRPLSTHDSPEAALQAARRIARPWAPARIRVLHSGQTVAEWYIRFPDGEWLQEGSTASPAQETAEGDNFTLGFPPGPH